jgi:hypothetical protein
MVFSAPIVPPDRLVGWRRRLEAPEGDRRLVGGARWGLGSRCACPRMTGREGWGAPISPRAPSPAKAGVQPEVGRRSEAVEAPQDGCRLSPARGRWVGSRHSELACECWGKGPSSGLRPPSPRGGEGRWRELVGLRGKGVRGAGPFCCDEGREGQVSRVFLKRRGLVQAAPPPPALPVPLGHSGVALMAFSPKISPPD